MDYYRRLHHSSYPSRPSPLGGSSQESRDERSRTLTSPANNDPQRVENAKVRSTSRYENPHATSSMYSPGASHASVSHPLRESTSAHVSPTKSHQVQQHRRHASLESRHHPHAHRRNLSQPQSGHSREGKIPNILHFFYFTSFFFLAFHFIFGTFKVGYFPLYRFYPLHGRVYT